jgi:hypothetical protein
VRGALNDLSKEWTRCERVRKILFDPHHLGRHKNASRHMHHT